MPHGPHKGGAILGNIHLLMDYALFLRDRHLFLPAFQSALPVNAWVYLLIVFLIMYLVCN